jgi:hypothetical protein
MSEREPHNADAEGLPWNDALADADLIPGTEEPDPAEVEGDEDDDAKLDVSHRPAPDPYDKYRQESLDARLAEELPDRTLREQARGVGGIQSPIRGEDDDLTLDLGEADDQDDWDDKDESAEESAIHIVDEDRNP